jgi:hypothetical protein
VHRKLFKEQTSRILPPLEISSTLSEEDQKILKNHVPQTGLEKFAPVNSIVRLGSTLSSQLLLDEKADGTIRPPMRLGNRSRRWLRRRYRELLAEIPQVTLSPPSLDSSSLQKRKRQQRALVNNEPPVDGVSDTHQPLSSVRVNWSSPLVLTRSFPSPLRSPTDTETKWIEKARELSKTARNPSTSRTSPR